MSIGYSTGLIQRNRQASRTSIGVRLGRYCMKRGISVELVALRFDVSRTTVYKWFAGDVVPRASFHSQIKRYIGE